MDQDTFHAARLEIVDFLIEALWDVPSREFVANLLGDEIALPEAPVNDRLDEGFGLLREFIQENRGRPVDEVAEELSLAYTRAFVGPRPPVLAHETYYRDDTEFIGKGLAEVEASYAAAGWSPPESYGEENDFVAVELAFLRDLIDRQRRGAEEAFGYERVFLEEHLTRWVDGFVDDVRERVDERLYLAAASIFAGFVEFEEELLAQVAPS